MAAEFDPAQPIYLQLIERIGNRIIRGDLQPGEKLPSVREMAVQFSVNPNTMQRVYTELEAQGIVTVRRGEGTFVTENHEQLTRLHRRLERDRIARFLQDMRDLGLKPGEVLASLQAYIAQTGQE